MASQRVCKVKMNYNEPNLSPPPPLVDMCVVWWCVVVVCGGCVCVCVVVCVCVCVCVCVVEGIRQGWHLAKLLPGSLVDGELKCNKATRHVGAMPRGAKGAKGNW